jgi:hypothetical protein
MNLGAYVRIFYCTNKRLIRCHIFNTQNNFLLKNFSVKFLILCLGVCSFLDVRRASSDTYRDMTPESQQCAVREAEERRLLLDNSYLKHVSAAINTLV